MNEPDLGSVLNCCRELCGNVLSPPVCAEIKEKYHKNLQAVTEAEDRKRKAEVIELEERMKSRVVSLVEDHDRALRGAEEYYCATQRKLLEEQKLLKVRRCWRTQLTHNVHCGDPPLPVSSWPLPAFHSV